LPEPVAVGELSAVRLVAELVVHGLEPVGSLDRVAPRGRLGLAEGLGRLRERLASRLDLVLRALERPRVLLPALVERPAEGGPLPLARRQRPAEGVLILGQPPLARRR